MESTQKNRPYGVYVVEEREGSKPFRTRIGAAFPHKSGGGFTVKLTAVPLSGELVAREPKAHSEQEA